jgi:dolichyl-diphosphooligosaccharide--protein glycosyltransferase
MHHRVWSYFTTGLIIVPISFLIIIYSAVKREKTGKWLLISWAGLALLTVIIDQMTSIPWWLYLTEGISVIALYAFFEKSSARIIILIWSAVTLLALLAQTRFAYYFAVNAALLSSYIIWKIPDGISYIIKLTGWKEANIGKGQTRAEKRRAKVKEETSLLRYLKPKHISYATSTVVIFFLTVYPNLIYGTYSQNDYPYQDCYQTDAAWCPSCSATLFLPRHPYGPNGDWYEALTWMKANTPDPFGNSSDAYHDLYSAPAPGESYDYPDSAYGVMSWWDYGHWITRMAYRLPNANPFQSGIGGITGWRPNASENPGASIFMTAQDEQTASWVMDELDSKYVVIDYETAWPKYHTMVTWSGKNQSDFFEYWYQDENGAIRTYTGSSPNKLPDAVFFYPAYYQSMCARLYTFGTEAVVPNNSTWAIAYYVQTDENGEEYKILTDIANGSPFATYEQAESYINDNPGYEIVGFPDWIPEVNNIFPVKSPIPLEALKEYRKIHSSPGIMPWGDYTTSYVEIYEYTDYKK